MISILSILLGPICYKILIRPGLDTNIFLVIYGKHGRTVIHRLKHSVERKNTLEFFVND